jgi:hypothetical protein
VVFWPNQNWIDFLGVINLVMSSWSVMGRDLIPTQHHHNNCTITLTWGCVPHTRSHPM